MKKRIISLILVVATAFLTLTGCAFNYQKKGVDYAEFNYDNFYTALQNLQIVDGDFGTNEEERQKKVVDAIAKALLSKATADDKKYTGTIGNHDAVYYCYMATDADGNIFFADKMNASSLSNLQIGLSANKDLNAAIEAVLKGKDVKDYLYSTSAIKRVDEGDAVSISYFLSVESGEGEGKKVHKTDVKWNEYHEVGGSDELANALIGLREGDTKGSVDVPGTFKDPETNGDIDVTYRYTNVKVEHIANDKATQKVKDDDFVFVSYTISFNAEQWYNETTKEYDLPKYYKDMKFDVANHVFTATVKYEVQNIEAYDYSEGTYTTEGEGDDAVKVIKDEYKTLVGELVGKEAGSTTSSIVLKSGVIEDGKNPVEITYKNVKVDWIVNEVNDELEVKYTPYPDAYDAEKNNKKEETNIYGQKIQLNEKELTYAIFPVYFVDVKDITSEDAKEVEAAAEVILNTLYSTVNSTETAEHDHTEEEHEHTTEYVFDSLNKDKDGNEFKFTYAEPEDETAKEKYKNNYDKEDDGKTLATLVGELVELYKTHTEKDKALTEALKSLKTAQTNYAKDENAPNSPEEQELLKKRQDAESVYNAAKTAEQTAKAKINTKVNGILATKKGETAIAGELVNDYKSYQYDVLEDAYKADIKEKLATAILKYLQTNTKFDEELPKRAVKQAYKAIMNTYKYKFYEGTTESKSNYSLYNGDFDAYLIATLKVDNKNAAKDAIEAEAEKTVQDIIMIYVFANAVEAKWNDADIMLTKDEKKEIKKNLENTALLYQQYYGISYNYNVDDSYHAAQFDKVMNFLLETKDAETDGDLKVYYKNIDYNKTTEQ